MNEWDWSDGEWEKGEDDFQVESMAIV